MATHWAHNVLTTCLRLREGERFLALTDPPLRAAGGVLCQVAARLGAGLTARRVIDLGDRGFSLVSQELLQQVSTADVIVSLFSNLDLEHEIAILRAAVSAFRSAGRGRWAFGAFIDEDVLACELTADYREVARVAQSLGARLQEANEVYIETEAGTDLRLRLGGRPVHRDTGILTEPGSLGNLPAGEVFAAPLEESAEGRLVVDLSVADLVLPEPIILTFSRGRVVAVEGGEPARVLERRLQLDPWAAVIGEFGLGANPHARIRGRATIDEKVLGTAHIALGGNVQFGGKNPAASHHDCVFAAPRILLDGKPL